MTEDEAKSWIEAHFGTSATMSMQSIVDAIRNEATLQNLIALSTLNAMWVRHIVDSAQLLTLIDPVKPDDVWIDIGTGAGFPGLVVAALCPAKVILVEPRKRRADFLTRTLATLGIAPRTRVVCGKIESVTERATIISARAVGHLGDIFIWSGGCFDKQTQWVLPKGRAARDEVESVSKTWHGMFHVEHSITDPTSLIVLASGVARR